MSSYCVCCHKKEDYPEGYGKYIEDDLIINNKSFFICNKCEDFINQAKWDDIDFKKTKLFLDVLHSCLVYKNSISKRFDKIKKTALFFNVRFSLKANIAYIKEINEAESYLRKELPELNKLYLEAMPDLALIGLKKTASEYYSFTGKELVDFLGINKNLINKFIKINNIKGFGYVYSKKEIEEIINLKK